MRDRTDGGPAFPAQPDADPAGWGMSLRDYFAGQALIGLTLHRDMYGWTPEGVATAAYNLADAMLAERDK